MAGARLNLAALFAVLVLAGCGSDDGSGGGTGPRGGDSSTDATAPPAEQRAGDLLDEWSDKVIPALLTFRARQQAAEQGDVAKAARLERKALRRLRPAEKFGRDARKEFIDDDRQDPVVKATTDAGDAWTEWAHTIRTEPPAGDFSQAQKIADLGADAIAAHRRAYRAAGREIPPAFQTP